MLCLRLIHWNAEEARDRAAQLRDAGYVVDADPLDPAALRRLRREPPGAVVIDLSRLPSHGRDVGIALRTARATRHVPLVFVGGAPDKVERVRRALPDAVFTPWSRIRSALRRAIAHPPREPVTPAHALAGYSGTSLPKKLGIREGETVALATAPPGVEKILGALPDGVTLRRRAAGRHDLILWFVRSRRELEKRIERMAGLVPSGGMWIAWPKKSSSTPSDLTQSIVRALGLAAGLVDYKICSIDATWSGLKFARRRRARRQGKKAG